MSDSIEKFREEMKRAVGAIDTMMFALDRGTGAPSTTVSDVLSAYNLIPDRIREAFDSLNKTAGNEVVSCSGTAESDFLKECRDYGEL